MLACCPFGVAAPPATQSVTTHLAIRPSVPVAQPCLPSGVKSEMISAAYKVLMQAGKLPKTVKLLQ